MKFTDVTNAVGVLLRWRKGEAIATALLVVAVAVGTAVGSPAVLGLSLLLAVIGNAGRLVYRESTIQRDQRKADVWWATTFSTFVPDDTQPLNPLDPDNLAEWEAELLANAAADVENADKASD